MGGTALSERCRQDQPRQSRELAKVGSSIGADPFLFFKGSWRLPLRKGKGHDGGWNHRNRILRNRTGTGIGFVPAFAAAVFLVAYPFA